MKYASRFPHPVHFLLAAALVMAAIPCTAQDARRLVVPAAATRKGALVTTVDANGPAANAGIAANDVITAIDGAPLLSLLQLAAFLVSHAPGDTLKVTIARAADGALVDVPLTLGADRGDASRPYMGLSVLVWVNVVPGAGASPDCVPMPPSL